MPKLPSRLPVATFFALSLLACDRPQMSYDFSPAQRTAVESLVGRGEGRRLVMSEENISPHLGDFRQEHPDYEPYFATDDFNGDGFEDFVIAVQEAASYDLYLILGTGSGYDPAEWFAGVTWLPEAGLFVRPSGSGEGATVGVGSFFSDDAIWFGWNEETTQLEPLPSEMEE